MYEVRIPDRVYEEAVHAAEAQNQSVEQFVAEAVQLHVKGTATKAKLPPEQLSKVREAQAQIKEGKFLTPQQIRLELHEHKAAWAKKKR